MESRPNFKFKESDMFTQDEVAELYKLFKAIDESNDGQLTQKELSNFIEEMYTRDGVDYTADDVNWVHSRVGEYYDRTNTGMIDFTAFLNMMEDWFIFTGAFKFTSDKNLKERVSMTEEEWKGFHEI